MAHHTKPCLSMCNTNEGRQSSCITNAGLAATGKDKERGDTHRGGSTHDCRASSGESFAAALQAACCWQTTSRWRACPVNDWGGGGSRVRASSVTSHKSSDATPATSPPTNRVGVAILERACCGNEVGCQVLKRHCAPATQPKARPVQQRHNTQTATLSHTHHHHRTEWQGTPRCWACQRPRNEMEEQPWLQ